MPLLDWVNRNQAEETATQVPYHLLKFEKSYGDAEQAKENLIIQGDNLQALKALLPLYGGQVKCIFIDPPYNTQSAFEHYDDKLEHAQWLSMMYPRLQLLKELLAEDGSIFIHLDDNEIDYLKVICDEIFGRKNFINRIAIDVRAPSAFSTVNKGVFKASEYLLWFAKDKESITIPKLRVSKEPDYAYDKWIDNPEDIAKNWIIRPLSDAFSEKVKLRTSKPDKIMESFNKFIIQNSQHVIRFASISDTKAGKDIIELKEYSYSKPNIVQHLKREDRDDIFILNGEQILFYSKNISSIDGELAATKLLTNIWTDVAWEGIAKEGQVIFNKGKKPEKLIKRCIELTSSHVQDIVMDSFLGSGTTAAVAHKMGRRYIGIEMGEHAKTHVIPRLEKVIDGEQGGISKTVNWQGGGGFSFYTLGSSVFDDNGFLNADVKFKDLASYIWWLETKSALNQTENFDNPFLGIHEGTAYYLLYNGILGDRRPNGGNVLTSSVLNHLNECHAHDGKRIVIGEASRLSPARLESLNIEFKQIPYSLYGNKAK
ncbi:site-specific DNA-methyltransferase [Acinetobacter piscicola]|uniref:site-specific DNA-methyltransferase n=1 Tax=Acinetobacter piscicola TaxID=2006115 RepID=UPI001020F307|nr:site-specific DNA-methyltransferase [Acinetobacter piscicola]RYL24661.1 site-specific DNA-methyltransferase [Acinetobacter piscicola]